MSRPLKVLLITSAAIVVTALTTACGTENISVAQDNPNHAGAVLFNQRCSGCHTFSYAATHGSASNPRTAQPINGPNFDVRCERPVTRVLYAIQNGGFSGAIMPQNVVVGQQAIEVAKFVATYSGRQSPAIPGATPCVQQAIGTLPARVPTATTASTAPATAAGDATAAAGSSATAAAGNATAAAGKATAASGNATAASGKAKHKPAQS